MRRLIALLVALGAAAPALAHGGAERTAPGWTLDPLLLVPLALLALLYLLGWLRLARRSRDRRLRSAALFASGWLVLAGALVSPLHEGGERSFTLHMIEHELIMLVATLLLAASAAGGVLIWSVPAGLRRLAGALAKSVGPLWRAATEPVTATLVQGMVMWAWHMPALFGRALASNGWHIAQHSCFALSALLFWSAMLHVRGGQGRLLLSAACLFATSLIGGALGALMALSSSPWYAHYAAMDLSGIGLSPSDDQQLAGLLMWIPGGFVHAGAALLLVYRWLQSGERNGATVAQG